MKITKIISGGQTGADQGGLSAGVKLMIPTGGTAPKQFKTENGPQPWLLGSHYHLKESEFSGYPPRTLDNVKDSDGTVIIGNTQSPGCKLTVRYCGQEKKPFICNPTAEELRDWIQTKNISILNVAGNRESKNPGIFDKTEKLIMEAFGKV